jgi:hypothetical protein
MSIPITPIEAFKRPGELEGTFAWDCPTTARDTADKLAPTVKLGLLQSVFKEILPLVYPQRPVALYTVEANVPPGDAPETADTIVVKDITSFAAKLPPNLNRLPAEKFPTASPTPRKPSTTKLDAEPPVWALVPITCPFEVPWVSNRVALTSGTVRILVVAVVSPSTSNATNLEESELP